MNSSIEIKEIKLKIPNGHIFIKKWIPQTAIKKHPIILMHDSLGSADLWRNFPYVLADKTSRCVIAYDRLGFGKSDARYELPSIEFIKEEAIKYFPAIKKQLSITRYIILGHSVGGAMSLHIGASDPDCLAIVTLSSQAFVEDRTVEGIKDAQQTFEEPGHIERLRKWHGEKATWVLKAWTDVWLSSEFSTWSLGDCISQVVCPVLVIHGDSDEYGSVAFPKFIANNVSGYSKMMLLKDCGHMPHMEKTEEVVNAVKIFLYENNVA